VSSLMKIQAKLTPEERSRFAVSRSVHPEAQDNYLRGVYFANEFLEADSLPKAIGNFQKAIEKDPTLAPGWAELAMAYFLARKSRPRRTLSKGDSAASQGSGNQSAAT
jgi:Tfp pilus assembly protein PilF